MARVSSPVTKRESSPVMKRNPRPKLYASAAERMAAHRARNSTLEFRADNKTAETVTKIAETIDVSRSDLLLSMTKFALTNHDWARFGLTHKTLPKYQGNPTMATRTPSPAQLAARAKFAEMARSGALKKKRKAAPKRKANPSTNQGLATYLDAIALDETFSESKLLEAMEHPAVTEADKKVLNSAIRGEQYSHIKLQDIAMRIRRYGAVAKAIKASRPKIGATEAKTINRLLMGRHGNPSMAMAAYREAGEFVMTVNGKSRTRFFERTDDAYANSYGFDYRLLSDVTKYGSPVKFTKTRAIVAVDEGADGKPITETWAIRGLKFYNTNPDKSKPRAYVRRVSQATGAPPSKRLTAQRKAALEAPAGYFPNPTLRGIDQEKYPYYTERADRKETLLGSAIRVQRFGCRSLIHAKNSAAELANQFGVPYVVGKTERNF